MVQVYKVIRDGLANWPATPWGLSMTEPQGFRRFSRYHGRPIEVATACRQALFAAAILFAVVMPATAQVRNRIETVAQDLVRPWALQFLPDGRTLVTERDGRLRLVTRAGKLSVPLAGTVTPRNGARQLTLRCTAA
jgi:glucose/arabinose dehydrogenase